MKKRIIPTILIVFTFLYYIIVLISQGLQYLHNDIIFAFISAFSILLLPAFISKIILKREYFGVGYILSTTIYPSLYILFLLFNRAFGINMTVLYNIASTLIIVSLLYLLSYAVIKFKEYEVAKISSAILGIMVVLVLLLTFRKILGLDYNSLLSIDFLQHNAVATHMGNGTLCITPNQCSFLFKKLGYTTFYHSIQVVHTIGSGVNLGIGEVSFSLAFISISAILISSLFNKYSKDSIISFLGAIITIFIFEMGAYSFNFILPQTLAFFLFLNIFLEEKINLKKVLIIAPILLASHFIFGPFFIVIIICYLLLFNQKNKLTKTATYLSLLTVIITFVANYRGFSVERILQTTDTTQLGFFTNYYFPDNLKFLLIQYGFTLVPLIISILYFLFKKDVKHTITYFAIFYISACLSLYFLAPTYANKFLIGSMVFFVLLIILLLLELRTRKVLAIILLSIIFLSSILFYLLNFKNYNHFYTQNSGKISALTKLDEGLLTHLQYNDYNCQIISDPYTQLMIESRTSYKTAGGHYQELATRKALIEFIDNPTEETYEQLLLSPDIKTNSICILLSSRVFSKDMYLYYDHIPWLNSMYEYEINSSYGIPDIASLMHFLAPKGYQITYLDSNFRLLTLSQE